jgi:D-alanyl-D-alanine carboxypeptidase (penicillin-binding protein 5/6)
MTYRLLLTITLISGLTYQDLSAQQPPDDPKPPTKAAADRLDGPPYVTAKAWAIADGRTGELLWGENTAEPRAIASTTKIMTAWIVLRLAGDDPKVLDEEVVFSERAAKTTGSSARLRAGERLPVRELLYGLMLPSGNDAAVALAEHFGPRFDPRDENEDADPVTRFVAEMNRQAKGLKLGETTYFDPHGLSRNQSSPRDLLTLTRHALQDERFRRYVSTRRRDYDVVGPNGETRTVTWNNTNKLLGIEGYEGIKTGTTAAAGSCLVSAGRRGDDFLLVVVLGSTSDDARYTDTRNLYRWAWRQRGHTPESDGR